MLDSLRSVHFVGVCGTAMAAVAVALKNRGLTVTGSDQKTYPPMSTFLEENGVEVMSGYSSDNLAHDPELVVIGNALSRGNPEVEQVLVGKMHYCSLPELLKEGFIRGKRSLVVTGTHGKTTTTSLLAWVFEHSGRNPGFLIGGIPENFGQGARFTDSEWFIIEGDEYDTAFFDKRSKFVHYLPEVAIINHLEFDHADIFEDLAAVQKTFRHFINLIPGNGLLLANGDAPELQPLLDVDHCPVRPFGLGDSNTLLGGDCRYEPEGTTFQVGPGEFYLPMIGEFNVRNALAVVGCARHCGLSDEEIQAGFSTFKGIKRRQEVRGEARGVTVIDDFGHHPTAIQGTLKALSHKYPGRRRWAIFEPRSNTTRRNVFQRELVNALGEADVILLAAVARLDQLPPEDRLSPEQLVGDLKGLGRMAAYLPNVDSIVDFVDGQSRPDDVVCIFSNGGFEDIHVKLLERLSTRPEGR